MKTLKSTLVQQLIALSDQVRLARRAAIDAGETELAAFLLDAGWAVTHCLAAALRRPIDEDEDEEATVRS